MTGTGQPLQPPSDSPLPLQERVRIIRDGIINYSGLLFSGLIGLVLVPILLHGLGSEQYGLWIAAMAVTGLAGSFDLGMGPTITQAIASETGAPQPEVSRYVTSAGASFLALGVVGGLIIALLGLPLSGALSLSPAARQLAPAVFVLAGVLFLAKELLAFTRAVLVGLRRFDAANFLAAAWVFLAALGTVALLALGRGLLAVAAWQSGSALAGALASLLVVVWLQPRFSLRPSGFEWQALRQRLPFSLTSQLTDAAIRVVWEAPALLIGLFRGSIAIVPYHIGQKFPVAVSQVSWCAAEALYPAASPEEAGAEQPRRRAILELGVRWVVVLVLPLAVVLWIVAPSLLQAWIGSVPPETTSVLRLSAAAVLVDALGVGAFYVLWGSGAVGSVFLVFSAVAATQVGLGIWLLLRMGVAGMAWAMLAAMALGSVALLYLAARSCRTPLGGMVRRIFAGLFLPVLVCVGVALGLNALPYPNLWARVVSVSLVSGLLYLATFYFSGARPEERLFLEELRYLPSALLRLVSRELRRLGDFVARSRRFHRAGVTLSSLLLFPLRRRLPAPRNEIELRGGLRLAAPPGEHLATLFDEVWVNECYGQYPFSAAQHSTVVDIGAHVGVFTLWAASRGPGVRVIAVEPSPENFSFLRRNVQASGLTNVSLLQCACAGQSGTLSLYARGPAALDTLYTHDNYGSSFRPRATVSVITLDELFARFNVQACHLLKLDCEGAEYEILFNATENALRKIQNIVMEYHQGLNQHTAADMVDFLQTHGFEVELGPPLDEEGGYLKATRRRGQVP
jgi:FkbM family methyltransferase